MRKYIVTNEYDNNIYLSCLRCSNIQKNEQLEYVVKFTEIKYIFYRNPIVSHAIIRANGQLEITNPHHASNCVPFTSEEIVAEQIDRDQRRQITCQTNPKSLWAQVSHSLVIKKKLLKGC